MSESIYMVIVGAFIFLGILIYYCCLPDEVIDKEVEKYKVAEYDRINGELNIHIICPHCQTLGEVRTKQVSKKVGVSGGKATAAILTSGVSLLATGLSRKVTLTQAHCSKCGSTWTY